MTDLKVIALSLAVHVGKQENAENHRDEIPLRENHAESVGDKVTGVERSAVDRAEQNQCGDLKQTNL